MKIYVILLISFFLLQTDLGDFFFFKLRYKIKKKIMKMKKNICLADLFVINIQEKQNTLSADIGSFNLH